MAMLVKAFEESIGESKGAEGASWAQAGQIINGLPIAANKKPKLTGVSARIKGIMADSSKRLRLAPWPA